jgi:hypothetical protein
MALLSLRSLMPFCTRGVNPLVSTCDEVGRFDDLASWMNCCWAAGDARWVSRSLAPRGLRDLALAK